MATKASAPALAAPQSSFAQFAASDVKGGEAAHAYRKTIVRAALEQAYKGNYSPLTEALAVVAGKSKKSRAWLAGFAAAGVAADPAASTVRKVLYKGKLSDAGNADARAEIETRTAESFAAFFAAFDTVMAEPPKAKKAKEEPEAGAATGPESNADAGDVGGAVEVADGTSNSVTLEPAALVDAVVDAIGMGMLSAAELVLIRAALAAHDAVQEAAAPVAAADAAPVADAVAAVEGEALAA